MSLRAAINAKCRVCLYDRAAPGTWREQIAQCTVVRCPLWPLRPAAVSGPFANPPRDPARVTPEWLKRPLGWVELGHRCDLPSKVEPPAEVERIEPPRVRK